MVRYYFPSTELIVAAGAGSPAALTLAPAAEFTVWSAETGGTKYTDLKAADGTTNLPVNGSGNPYADSNGYPPDLWGPDGVREMWRQVGSVRTPMYPSTEMFDTLINGARRNAANTFTQAVSFTSGTATAFSVSPTVSGSPLVSSTGLTSTARSAVPYGNMAWDATTDTWWAYDPATFTWVNGGPRPSCPPGTCTYDARNDPAAIMPTGTQAPQKFGNLPGDTFRLHQSSPLWPA